jgi:hypothetical protein
MNCSVVREKRQQGMGVMNVLGWAQAGRGTSVPNVTLTVLVPANDSGSTDGMRPF